MEKVLVIGLDGATFDNLKPWIKEGELPNFADIMENGVLKSTIPTLTAPAWTSLFTGKNPGKHGFFDFFIPKPDYSYSLRTPPIEKRNQYGSWYLMQRENLA